MLQFAAYEKYNFFVPFLKESLPASVFDKLMETNALKDFIVRVLHDADGDFEGRAAVVGASRCSQADFKDGLAALVAFLLR